MCTERTVATILHYVHKTSPSIYQCMHAQEEVISETSETEKVLHLTAIQKTQFGYGLGNGTVGVYDRSARVWRVKSKNKVSSDLRD